MNLQVTLFGGVYVRGHPTYTRTDRKMLCNLYCPRKLKEPQITFELQGRQVL